MAQEWGHKIQGAGSAWAVAFGLLRGMPFWDCTAEIVPIPGVFESGPMEDQYRQPHLYRNEAPTWA